jgi:acyl carrier protein
VREKLRRFITAELMKDAEYELDDGESIFKGGLIGSIDMVKVQLFIEDAFDVRVPDPEMTVANMDTLDQIAARVTKEN